MKHPEPQMKRLTVYAPVLSLCLVICIIIYYIASSALANIIKNSLEGMAVQGARTVQSETEKRLAIVRMMSRNGLVQNQDLPVEQRLYMLTAQFDATQFEDIAIADLAGNSVTMRGNSFFAGDRNYFYEALTGKETLGSPVISRSTGDLIVVFAVPVYNSGIITGVLAAAWPVEELCKITDQISITKDGFALVIDSTGAIIAHKDRTLIANDRILKEHEKDNILKSAEAAGLAMRSGKTGTIDYTSVEGESRFMGYAPIQGTNWFIGVTAPKSQVFKGTNQILVFIVICIVLFFIAVMFYNVYSNWLRNRLQSQERLTQSVIDAGGIVTLEIDKMGAVLNWNKYFESKTGYTEGDISKGSSVLEMVADEDRKRAEALLQDIREGTRQGTIELSMKGKDSRIVYLIWSIDSADNNLSDNVIELMGLDITEIMKAKNELQKKNKELSAMYDEQVALYEEILASEEELKDQYDRLLKNEEILQTSENRYRMVTAASGVGVWERDLLNKDVFYYSPRWFEIFGLNACESEGFDSEGWRNRVHPEDLGVTVNKYNAYLEHKSDSYDDEFRILMENGEYKWVRTLAAAIWDDKGMPVKLTGSIEDITAQKEFENRIRKLAYYDVLTGLPNRVMFIEKFNEISASDECNIALIFMDVDNFKLINDSYGHNVGDDILVETGKRVLEVEIENMMLFRLGGDEFAILLWGDVGKEKVEDFVCEVVSRISKSYYIQEYIFNITISMGLAMYPADARNLRDLMKNSDMAMYKAKEAGKNRHVFFDNIMKEEALKRMLISNQLHGALGNNEFKLFYQPQYSTDGVAEGFEALIRWNNPELGNVSPAEFICIAEENRSIIPLGEWVLENSCRFLKEINVNDDANYFVSINISVLQIIRSDFSDYVLGLIKEYGLKPELLELEITESVFIESFDNIVKNITLLRQAGIRIALDDFGKGYSSLNYLTMLPITTLKIDKSFIDNIRQRDEKDVLVDSIIMIGRSLGLEVVAEGVETVEQLEYLRKYGCDRIQGYYFSKPLPEEEVWSVIEKKTDSR